MKQRLPFVKMHGAGNDFVMLDARNLPAAPLQTWQIAALCDRRRGIGADGLIVLAGAGEQALQMDYYNADGCEADMCGNGARCTVAFARHLQLAGESCRVRTRAGVLQGRVVGEEIEVSLPAWQDLRLGLDLPGSPFAAHHFVNTGVPHLVVPVPDVTEVDLASWGPRLRRHEALAPMGANINWVSEIIDDGAFPLRTYERGVEDETLACGTGAAAAAVVLCQLGLATARVVLRPRSGDHLTVTVSPQGSAPELLLQGPAVIAFQGEVDLND